MEYKPGDKFIIEIESLFENGDLSKPPICLYRIKGFNSLVFDASGLDRLEKYEESKEKKDETFEVGDEILLGSPMDPDSKYGYVLIPNPDSSMLLFNDDNPEEWMIVSMEDAACPQTVSKKFCHKTGVNQSWIKKTFE